MQPVYYKLRPIAIDAELSTDSLEVLWLMSRHCASGTNAQLS